MLTCCISRFLDEVEITETRREFVRIEESYEVKLIIKEVTSELKGTYRCEIENEHGVSESSATLTVNCVPHIVKKLQDTTINEGGKLHLQVEVDVAPEPTVKWLHNGNEISADARIKITRDSHRNETYNLTADLVKYEDGGEYEVIITNTLGTVSCKSSVNVQSKYPTLTTLLRNILLVIYFLFLHDNFLQKFRLERYVSSFFVFRREAFTTT